MTLSLEAVNVKHLIQECQVCSVSGTHLPIIICLLLFFYIIIAQWIIWLISFAWPIFPPEIRPFSLEIWPFSPDIWPFLLEIWLFC